MKGLRILQVVPRLEGGGVEEEVLLIAQAIQQAGGHAFVASEGGALVPDLEATGATFIPLKMARKNPLHIWRNAKALEACVQEKGIQLLHVHSRAPAWSVAQCAKRLRMPWIATYHAAYGDTNPFKHLYNSIMARATWVVAISGFIAHHIDTTYGKHSWYRRDHLRLIPRGIDTDFLTPHGVNPHALHHLRDTLSIPPEDAVILLPGRFRKLKGHGVLLEAFATFLHGGQRATLLFVGETPQDKAYRTLLEERADQLNLTPHVRFLPYVQDLRPFYALSDCVVVPSLVPEGFGRVIAEAASCRKVVIASDHGAAPEVIASEEIGLLVPPNDASALEKALSHLFSLPPKQREKMGKAARAHIQKHFSKEQFFTQTRALYEECLS